MAALVDLHTGARVAEYEYGPFGEAIAIHDTNASAGAMCGSTKYRDPETGFLYFGFRYLDPQRGQWLTRDPIGERGGHNLYGYVGNNPVGLTDFLGLEWDEDCIKRLLCKTPTGRASLARIANAGGKIYQTDRQPRVFRRIKGSSDSWEPVDWGAVTNPVEKSVHIPKDLSCEDAAIIFTHESVHVQEGPAPKVDPLANEVEAYVIQLKFYEEIKELLGEDFSSSWDALHVKWKNNRRALIREWMKGTPYGSYYGIDDEWEYKTDANGNMEIDYGGGSILEGPWDCDCIDAGNAK